MVKSLPTAHDLTDEQLSNSISNHEAKSETVSERYRQLVEEQAHRSGNGLNVDRSLAHLREAAKDNRFTTYGALANASGIPWNKARRRMDGAHGHLDLLLAICHAKGWPLLTAICVNQENVESGKLDKSALKGFVNAAQRLNYNVIEGEKFLRDCQDECFTWEASQSGST